MAVAPVVYGAGIQNKVLEAMACATPVVASPQAVSALNTRAGIDLEVAESPEKMAAIILELLKDLKEDKPWQRGTAFVEDHHTGWRCCKSGKSLRRSHPGRNSSTGLIGVKIGL